MTNQLHTRARAHTMTQSKTTKYSLAFQISKANWVNISTRENKKQSEKCKEKRRKRNLTQNSDLYINRHKN